MINLLITGGAGFIGSNFLRYWILNNPESNVLVLDKLTYAGNISNIKDCSSHPKFKFIKGDICDSKLISILLRRYQITHIANFAAESHVDRSINFPDQFMKTNILGTYSLLDEFKKYWSENRKPKNFKFLQISTDEVFGSLEIDNEPFTEESPYSPRSPYSASKASGDHLVKAWFETYGLPVVLTNCSNNYGPYHYPEKLIPLSIINILEGKNIPIYGNGKNIRDWLYVEDHCRALELILKSKKVGKNFCIGGSNEVSNIELITLICNSIDELVTKLPVKPSKKLITFVPDRLGHDFRYSINASKIKKELNWQTTVPLKQGIKNTINWYLNNESWWRPLLSDIY